MRLLPPGCARARSTISSGMRTWSGRARSSARLSMPTGSHRSSSGVRPAPARRRWRGSSPSTTKAHFVQLSAVTSGVADLRAAIKEAADRIGMTGQRTVLFIDEIHRFNKAQQDAILPLVEDGTVILIGATTENPSFEVNSSAALALPGARFASADRRRHRRDRPPGDEPTQSADSAPRACRFEDDALDLLVNLGQWRCPVRAQHARVRRDRRQRRERIVTCDLVAQAAQRRAATYDKSGDDHYDAISAFTRPCAGLIPMPRSTGWPGCWSAGEDPLYVARRVVSLCL